MKATNYVNDTLADFSEYETITGSMTIEPNGKYIINDTTTPINLTLPVEPEDNSEIVIVDQMNTLHNHPVTLISSEDINGDSSDYVLDLKGTKVTIIYANSSVGWIITSSNSRYLGNYEVDDSNIRNNFILCYNELSEKLEYLSHIDLTEDPILSGNHSGTELSNVVITIDNYDPTFLYLITVTDGVFERVGDEITWTMPEVTEDTNHTLTITAEDTIGGFPVSYDVDFDVMVSDIAELSGPTSGEEETVVQIYIANYHSGNTYDIVVNHGSYERIDDLINWTLEEVADDTIAGMAVTSTGIGDPVVTNYQVTVKDTASLAGDTMMAENQVATVNITDYDAGKYTYSVHVTGGSYVRTDGSINWTMPEVTDDEQHTLTVTQHETGFPSLLTRHNIMVINSPEISGPSFGTEGASGTYTIDNFNASYTYDVSVSGGTVAPSGSVITWGYPMVADDTEHTLTVHTDDTGVPTTSYKYVEIKDYPTLSGDSVGVENTISVVTIDDYSASYSYDISVTGGSTTRTNQTINWTLPQVSDNTQHALTLTQHESGFPDLETIHTLTVLDSASVSGPSYGTEEELVIFSIDNYDAVQYTYDIGITGGSAYRTDDLIYWTLPQVNDDTEHTLTITQHESGQPDIDTVHNIEVKDKPSLAGATNFPEMTNSNFTITDYNPTKYTYNWGVTGGSIVPTGGMATWTAPTVSQDTSHTVTLTQHETGFPDLETSLNVIIKDGPSVSGPSSLMEGSTANFTIDNYNDTKYTYDISVSTGSLSITGANIAWTLPQVTDDEQHTLTTIQHETGFSDISTVNYLTIKDKPSVSGPATEVEEMVANIVITDYDAGKYTYSINVTGGSYVRTDANIAWTLPEVSVDTIYTMTVTQHETGEDDLDTTHDILVTNAAPVITVDTALLVDGSDFTLWGEWFNNVTEDNKFIADEDEASVMTIPEIQESGEDDWAKYQPKVRVTTEEFNVESTSGVDELVLSGESEIDPSDGLLLVNSSNSVDTMTNNIAGVTTSMITSGMSGMIGETGDYLMICTLTNSLSAVPNKVFRDVPIFHSTIGTETEHIPCEDIVLEDVASTTSSLSGSSYTNNLWVSGGYHNDIGLSVNGMDLETDVLSVDSFTGTEMMSGTQYSFTPDADCTRIARLDDNHICIAYSDIGAGKVIIGTLRGDGSFVFGTPQTFKANRAYSGINLVVLSPTKICVSYVDNGDSNYGKTVIGNISGHSVTWSSFDYYYMLDGVAEYENSMVKLDNTTLCIAFTRRTDNHGRVIIGTVSGNSVTWSTGVMFSSTNAFYTSMTRVSDSGFCITFGSWVDKIGRSVVGTVSGTTITLGSEAQYGESRGRNGIAELDSTHVVVSHRNVNTLVANIGTISGTTITWGSEFTFENSVIAGRFTTVLAVSSSEFYVTYETFTKQKRLVKGTISGSNITFTDPFVFDDDNNNMDMNSTFINDRKICSVSEESAIDMGVLTLSSIDINTIYDITYSTQTHAPSAAWKPQILGELDTKHLPITKTYVASSNSIELQFDEVDFQTEDNIRQLKFYMDFGKANEEWNYLYSTLFTKS